MAPCSRAPSHRTRGRLNLQPQEAGAWCWAEQGGDERGMETSGLMRRSVSSMVVTWHTHLSECNGLKYKVHPNNWDCHRQETQLNTSF